MEEGITEAFKMLDLRYHAVLKNKKRKKKKKKVRLAGIP